MAVDKGLELTIPIASIKPIQPVADEEDQKYIVPLDGKWLPDVHPIHIGKNYSTLTNMRYAGGHPEGILGCTAINSTIIHATYFKPRSAFHFKKGTPVESHVLTQTYNTGITAAVVMDHIAAVPATGEFVATPIWTDSAGASIGMFSDAPGGEVAYCNKVDTCLWGGQEMRVAAFITSTAAVADTGPVTNPKDYTEIINNTQSDAENIVAIGGGIDTYTKLCIHAGEADGTAGTAIIDSETSAKTITAAGDAHVDTAQAKFGTGSIAFDGTGDYLSLADHADWEMGAGAATIDFWVRIGTSADAIHGLFSQYADATHFVECYYNKYTDLGAEFFGVEFKIQNGASMTVFVTAGTAFTPGTWHHIAVIRGWGGNANQWIVAVDGSISGATMATDSDAWPDLAAAFEIGRSKGSGTYLLNGWIDEFRVSKGVARWTAAFTPPAQQYRGAALTYLLGSLRPLQGWKDYVSAGNLITSSRTVKVWTGTTWETLTATDNTDTGAALAATGTVTFASTALTAKPRYIEGYYLYWYQVTLSAGEADLYHVTLDAPFQAFYDMWDGIYRNIASFYMYISSYKDMTLQARTEDYYAGDSSTYAELYGFYALSGSDYLEVGLLEKTTGLRIIPAVEYVNTVAASAMSIDYWDGTTYKTVGAISDGTSEGAITLAKTGVVTWNNTNLTDEAKKSVANGYPMYYYRIRFDKDIVANPGVSAVRLDYIGGIPSPNKIEGYSFPLNAAGRLMLGCDNYGDKNKLIISASGSSQVFNGSDYFEVYFGNDGALTCGTSIFAQYASNIFNMVLVFKKDESWTLTWSSQNNETIWERFQIAPNIGCPAPRTLRTISAELDRNIAQTKTIAIWRGNSGIYISNGQTPLCVSDDFKNVFDQTKTPHVNLAMMDSEYGFYDNQKREYHWLWASGTSTTLDKEYVLDTRTWQAFEIDRTTGVRLQLGIDVEDMYGNQYTYGFDNLGYMLRLENGTTFNGVDMAFTMEVGAQLPVQSDLFAKTLIVRANLIAVAKNTDSAVTLTHTIDGGSGTAYTLSVADATHSYANVIQDIWSTEGVFHVFKLSATTDDETKGLEPLYLAVLYQKVRDHIS